MSKAYPKYKPSGVKWLGDVPEHWEVKRLKYQVSINDETLPETTDPDYEMLYVDISSVDPTLGIVQKDGLIFENAPSRARRIVRDGDTVVSTVRTYLRAIAPVIEPEGNLIVSTGFAVIRPRKIDKAYLSATIRAPYFIEEVVSRSVGVSYPAINASEIGFISVPLPPLTEQQAIAAFLDRETGRIDALIAKKERLLELLAEQRTALISRAVTKGLDASVKLKPSGVEWLGDVPEHWETWKLAHGFDLVGSGTTPPSDELEWYEGTIPWITTSELRENLISSTEKCVSREAVNRFSALKIFPKGSLAIAMYGATIGRLGILGLEATTNQACCVMNGGNVFSIKFVYFWMQAFKESIILLASGGGQPNISQDKIRSLKIPCPSVTEQQAIAAFLDRETAKIDALSVKVSTVIERLKEYRTALISSAVTGKIDVREAV